jgi:putative oxidoreductase
VLENLVILVARLLLALIFVHEGIFLVLNFDTAAVGMARLGVPPYLLVATIVLQLVAGLAVAAGCYARAGALALALFCVATAVLFHAHLANRNELLQFEKDLAIAGGLWLLMLRGAGAWSIDEILAARRDPKELPMPDLPTGVGSSA